MLKKLLITLIILLLFNGLNAQNDWTTPKRISTGMFNQAPFITVDKTGALHAFWSKADTLPGNKGCVMHASSNDEGNSWSTPVNISNNPTDRPWEPQAVVDSQNNLHLFYHNLYNCEIWYLKCISGIWSAPQKLDFYTGAAVNPLIDLNDRIYLFWWRGDNRYNFSYLENQSWSPAKIVSDSLDCGGLVVDKANNIHIAGASLGNLSQRKAYYYRYDRQNETFTGFTNISNNKFITFATAIAASNDSVIHIPVGFNNGNRNRLTTDYVYSKNPDLYNWIIEENVCSNVVCTSRQIIADSNDRPYIFIQNAGDMDTLYLFSKHDSTWLKENVACAYIEISDYKPIIFSDNIYLIYASTETGAYIYFRKKKLQVGIAEDSPQVVSTLEMSVYPNPFNATASILLNLTQDSNLKLEIFNVKGELVQSIYTGKLKSGRHNFNFNAANLNSGIYFCRLNGGRDIKTTKLILLK